MDEALFQILEPQTIAKILADFAKNTPDNIDLVTNLPELAQIYWERADRMRFNGAVIALHGYDWPDKIFDLAVALKV